MTDQEKQITETGDARMCKSLPDEYHVFEECATQRTNLAYTQEWKGDWTSAIY